MKNRRIVVTRLGGPDVLEVVEEDLPNPGPDQVRVKTLAAGVSAYDLMIRSVSLPGNPQVPFTPGEDVVGVVDELGEDVSTVEIGQRVAAWTFGRSGTYAQFVCVPADAAVPVPSSLDSAEAVALVVNYLTARLYLHRTARVRRGERILVHGAAGGLGTALLELGRQAGLEAYGTASSYNHDVVSSLGATPIDYRAVDFVERIQELTGDGVDVVFDPIGGVRQLRRSYRALRRGGRLVPLGSVATATAGRRVVPLSLLTILLLKLIPDGRRVPLTPNMMKFPHTHLSWYRESLAELLEWAAAGTIKPLVAERFPLMEAARAHEQLERGGHAGKVVLMAGG